MIQIAESPREFTDITDDDLEQRVNYIVLMEITR